jgi:hypothetical protein
MSVELTSSEPRSVSLLPSTIAQNYLSFQIKEFSRLAVGTTRADGKSCPALKIVVLDEADSMTNAAQVSAAHMTY